QLLDLGLDRGETRLDRADLALERAVIRPAVARLPALRPRGPGRGPLTASRGGRPRGRASPHGGCRRGGSGGAGGAGRGGDLVGQLVIVAPEMGAEPTLVHLHHLG